MKRFVVVLLLAHLAAAGSAAQPVADVSAREGRRWSFQTGVGFMTDPTAFVLGFDGGYRVSRGFTLGGALQLGLDDGFTMVAPTAYLRYSFDLARMGAPESLHRLSPFVQTGLGFTYMDRNRADDIGFLMNMGLGAEYRLTRSMSLGSKMSFNFLPVNVLGDNFYYSWEVGTVRFHF